MTNHPNRNKTRFTVRVGDDLAKFSSWLHAMDFASAHSYGGRLVEVGSKNGLVGQYRDGKPTEEFKMHDAQYREDVARQQNGDATCRWFLLCTEPTAGYVAHPVLGRVPTCKRCADKHGLVLKA